MSRNIIGWILIIIILVFYVYGTYEENKISWDKTTAPDNLPVPKDLDVALASISALLLTNLGAVLGISVTDQGSAIARRVLPGRNNAAARTIPPPMNSREQIQLVCMLIYIVALLACFVTWIHNGFSSDPKDVLPFVSQSAKMCIGVAVAYLTFILR